jgi:hypothetical protein
VNACGAPPIPKPTSPRKTSIQAYDGENEETKPKIKINNEQKKRHILRPKRSHINPQKGLPSIIPKNTTLLKIKFS